MFFLKIPGRLILISIISCFLASHLQAAETVPLRILLNTVDKGEHFLDMTSEGDILLAREQLKELGFRGMPEKSAIAEGGSVSLKSLSPDVSFELNMMEATLVITADPKLLEKQIIDLGSKRPENVIYTRGNSAFLNYAVNYSAGDEFAFQGLNIPTEAGIRTGDYLAYSNFFYTKTAIEARFVRSLTNIIKDDPASIRRYTAGDIFASSGAFGGSVLLGGLSVTKNYSVNPYFIRYQGLDLSGALKTPSEVDLYINNVRMKKETLPPGEFEFSNLYGQTGAGDAVLVIKDAFGREERIATPFYLSSNLLKPGLHDYSYNYGFKRADFGVKSFEYDGPAFMANHRYGFADTVTGGLRAEADEDIVNFGPQATLLLRRAGEIDTVLAWSRDGGKTGHGAFFGYAYSGSIMNGNASVRYFSEDYTNLSLKGGNVKPHFEGRVGLGFHARSLGSISATVQFLSRYGDTDIKRANIFYSRNLGENAGLLVTAARTDDIKTTYEFFAGITFMLGKDHFSAVNYQSQDSGKTVTTSIEKSPPRGAGLGYRLQAEARESERWTYGGASHLQYNGPYGIYSAGARRTSGADTYDFNLSGGIACIDKSCYLARPVTDSFGLVKVGDIEGVRVYYSNDEIARTNEKGEAIAPSLVSYIDNKLSFEATDVPLNYELTETEKYISPPYRSGSIVKFEVAKIQAFEGRLFLVVKGEKKPAESAVLVINVNGKIVEAVVGKRGEFYIENLRPGLFPSKVSIEGKECGFEMVVPESREMNVNLGDMICEMD